MDDLQINPKFKELLPPLSEEEHNQLEESIIKNGCETPLMIWENQIIDGHNRHNICTKNNIPFRTVDRSIEFETEDEVLEWIYTNQLGRRNLTKDQKTDFIGKLYNLRKKRHGGDRKSSGNNYHLILDVEPKRTAEVMAKEFGVSEKTVRTAGAFVEAKEKYPEIVSVPTQKDAINMAKALDVVDTKRQKEIREDLAQGRIGEVTKIVEKYKRDFEKGEDPDVNFSETMYKIHRTINSININGGISYIWRNWSKQARLSYYENTKDLAGKIGNFIQEMEEQLNNE